MCGLILRDGMTTMRAVHVDVDLHIDSVFLCTLGGHGLKSVAVSCKSVMFETKESKLSSLTRPVLKIVATRQYFGRLREEFTFVDKMVKNNVFLRVQR